MAIVNREDYLTLNKSDPQKQESSIFFWYVESRKTSKGVTGHVKGKGGNSENGRWESSVTEGWVWATRTNLT